MIDRVETNVDGSAPCEAHIVRKSDGAGVEVHVSKDFPVAAVERDGQALEVTTPRARIERSGRNGQPTANTMVKIAPATQQ